MMETEQYSGNIDVEFDRLPAVKLVSVNLDPGTSWFMRIAESTRRRFFTLEEDWYIRLGGIKYEPKLNGEITIPSRRENEEVIVYDGASIPLPWFVSFLTIGILRPLGAMLIASIVHDFGYKFGYLWVRQKDAVDPMKVDLPRHHTDRLFRDMLQTVNRTFPVEWIAWFAVRLGWVFGIEYKGESYSGQKPVLVLGVFSAFTVLVALGLYRWRQLIAEYFEKGLMVAAVLYFVFYIATALVLRFRKAPQAEAANIANPVTDESA